MAALIAVAYRYVLGLADNSRTYLLSFVNSPIRIVIMFAALIAIGLLVGWITQSEPMIKGSGIPQVEGQVRGYFTPKWLPVLVKKFVAGAIAVFCGLSLGREGPSIQLGAMAAQGIAETTHRKFPDSRFIIICGACAGLSAAFNAPLAGILFALEEIHKSFSYRSVFSAMVADQPVLFFMIGIGKVTFGTFQDKSAAAAGHEGRVAFPVQEKDHLFPA